MLQIARGWSLQHQCYRLGNDYNVVHFIYINVHVECITKRPQPNLSIGVVGSSLQQSMYVSSIAIRGFSLGSFSDKVMLELCVRMMSYRDRKKAGVCNINAVDSLMITLMICASHILI